MTNFFKEMLAVGFGGFIGSCLRFIFTKIGNKYLPYFPLGTLVSNLTAGFLIGLIIGYTQDSQIISEKIKLFLIVGFLGGLSTFSTFNMDTINLFQEHKYGYVILNILLNLGLSLLFAYSGLILSKR